MLRHLAAEGKRLRAESANDPSILMDKRKKRLIDFANYIDPIIPIETEPPEAPRSSVDMDQFDGYTIYFLKRENYQMLNFFLK